MHGKCIMAKVGWIDESGIQTDRVKDDLEDALGHMEQEEAESLADTAVDGCKNVADALPSMLPDPEQEADAEPLEEADKDPIAVANREDGEVNIKEKVAEVLQHAVFVECVHSFLDNTCNSFLVDNLSDLSLPA